MPKHLLLPIRISQELPHSVQFTNSFFKNKAELELTLFYLCEGRQDGFLSEMWNKEGDSPVIPSASSKYLEKTRSFLTKNGVSESNVYLNVCTKKLAIAKEIIIEANKKLYDAVIIGKKTASLLESFFSSTVNQEILSSGLSFPLWYCPSLETNRQNVLLCLDGSENAGRIADHVGYILEGETHTVTLFHVDKGDDVAIEKSFDEARKVLLENGIRPENIHTYTRSSQRVVNSIIEMSEKKKFAVIAVGWTGRTQRADFRAWLTGEKCRTLMGELENASLWIVP